jgi:hypothetical protein
LLTGLLGATWLAVGKHAAGEDAASLGKGRVTPVTLLIRNPAFTKKKVGDSSALCATTKRRKTVAYRMDAEAEFVWDEIPSAEDHLRGVKLTCDELQQKAVKKYASRDPQAVRKEVLALLEESMKEGVLLDPSKRAYLVIKVPKTKE